MSSQRGVEFFWDTSCDKQINRNRQISSGYAVWSNGGIL